MTTSTNAILAWRNWAAEYGTITDPADKFEPQAPVTNLLRPQLGKLAIANSLDGGAFFVDWSQGSPAQGRPVQLIALLNHNIIELTSTSAFAVSIFDADGGSYNPVGFPTPSIVLARESAFQAHIFWLLPETLGTLNKDRVTSFAMGVTDAAICGRIDPVTGEIERQPFRAGGVWAGPIWRPERGMKFASPQFGVVEQPRGSISIGGQRYPQPQARQRTLQAELTLLRESEAFSDLQDMAAWCAVSRPVICVPDISDAELAYRQGLYGYFDNPLTWRHYDVSGGETSRSREYTSSFSITEAL